MAACMSAVENLMLTTALCIHRWEGFLQLVPLMLEWDWPMAKPPPRQHELMLVKVPQWFLVALYMISLFYWQFTVLLSASVLLWWRCMLVSPCQWALVIITLTFACSWSFFIILLNNIFRNITLQWIFKAFLVTSKLYIIFLSPKIINRVLWNVSYCGICLSLNDCLSK